MKKRFDKHAYIAHMDGSIQFERKETSKLKIIKKLRTKQTNINKCDVHIEQLIIQCERRGRKRK